MITMKNIIRDSVIVCCWQELLRSDSTWGDSGIILSAILTAAMLEIYYA